MEHIPSILLIGFQNSLDIESVKHIDFVRCNNSEQAIELTSIHCYDLIICKFQLPDQNAPQLNLLINPQKEFTANTQKKNKLLVITSNWEEEKVCKNNNLLYYPENLNLKTLVLKLIELPKEPKKIKPERVIIDFKELFIRVDNNRIFIQTVIEKFFSIKESRLDEIKAPLLAKEYKEAKNAAHKLKGVLANFSMLEARSTIIELEKLILDKNHEQALIKFSQLIKDIEAVEQFYNNNLDLFKE